MKNTIKKIAIVAISLMSLGNLSAQKIAHVNLDSLINIMPETKNAKEAAQNYLKDLEKKYDELARQLTNLHQRVEAIKTVYQQHSTAPDRTVLETMEMAQRRYLLWALKIPNAEIPLNTWRIFSRICLRKADHEHGLLKKAQSAKEQFRAHGESVLLDKNVAALAFCVVLPTFE